MLTEGTAREAVQLALPAIVAAMERGVLKRKQLHIVVGTRNVPPSNVMELSEGSSPEVVYEEAINLEVRPYEGPYDKIARSKFAITWRTGLPSRIVQLHYPHLLQPGDTKYWGSWIEANIIAAASGAKPYHDEWASRLVVASVIALGSQRREIYDDPSFKDQAFIGTL